LSSKLFYMSAELQVHISTATDSMTKAITHLEAELVKVRAGRANPQMFDGLVVDYYGSPTPISQVGNIAVADARTLTIQPWEKNMLNPSSDPSSLPILVLHLKTMVPSFVFSYLL